ncbi:WW-containing oxidoreductase [Coleophoma cylindrospora]|uniref:WW-containing oxidoreductase n=1 Tax=Coleophoma cylindrospora TaxID=1849047 RepID=A0A3D8S1Y0_9HELO|nr:WW-containing oxidoreductase [Coleophoma cylindrospora]
MSVLSFLYSQLFVTPPLPQYDFTGQTFVITGGNTGLGLEAARHLVRLKAARIILGVRSLSRGEEAVRSLNIPPGSCEIEVLLLNLESYDSVKGFAAKVAEHGARIDAVLLNAGKATQDFYLAEGNESTLTVNVMSTFLLLILLLPGLRLSAARYGSIPRISIVASDRHVESNLPEWREKDPFAVLNDANRADMNKRYHVSKLLQILLVRALAECLATQKQEFHVSVNTLTPGLCRSSLIRDLRGLFAIQLAIMILLLARTTEVGSRTLVHAIGQGAESHGKYMNDGKIQEHALSAFVRSPEGKQASEKMWEELMIKLEVHQPNIRDLVRTR